MKKEKKEAIIANNRMPNRSQKRHLMEGELFLYNGVEFRVMACQPKDGFITRDTAVHVSGLPIVDVKSMTIRAISNSLPNRHKNLSKEEIKNMYLDPYFKGQSRYVDRTREIAIQGVTFTLVECVPKAGLITCKTKIKQGIPMTADELREKQEEDDMAYARRLQAEEDRGAPMILFRSIARQSSANARNQVRNANVNANANNADANANANGNGNAANPNQATRQGNRNAREIQVPIQSVNQFFDLIRQLQQENQAAQREGRQPRFDHQEPWVQFLQQFQEQRQAQVRSLPPGFGDRLPSYTYRQSSKPSSPKGDIDQQISSKDKQTEAESSQSSLTCRICLENYADGDKLKILPCFHKYHEDCINSWFQMSRKCPICNMDVTQAF